MSLGALTTAEAAATERYKETAQLTHRRLADIQAEAAASSAAAAAAGTSMPGEQERMARMAWLCTMLLNTSEEALRTK